VIAIKAMARAGLSASFVADPCPANERQINAENIFVSNG